jgi:hypothetical protein
MTVIATGDKIIDEEVKTYGGQIGVLTASFNALASEAMRAYMRKISTGEVALLKGKTATEALEQLEGPKVETPASDDGKDPLAQLVDDFLKGANAYLEEIEWSNDLEDDLLILKARSDKITEFLATVDVTVVPPEGLLEHFKNQIGLTKEGEAVREVLTAPPDSTQHVVPEKAPIESMTLLEELGLPRPLHNVLFDEGIYTIEALKSKKPTDLLGIRGVGAGKLAIIQEALMIWNENHPAKEPINEPEPTAA